MERLEQAVGWITIHGLFPLFSLTPPISRFKYTPTQGHRKVHTSLYLFPHNQVAPPTFSFQSQIIVHRKQGHLQILTYEVLHRIPAFQWLTTDEPEGLSHAQTAGYI